MKLQLQGRRAIVTGGSKGLGFAAAQSLVAEGAHIVVCSRNQQELDEAVERLRAEATKHQDGESERSGAPDVKDQVIVGIQADMRDHDQLIGFVNNAAQALGGIDIVVNNAGGAHPGNPESIDDESFVADFNIKVLSWQRVITASLPYLRQSNQARIINIGAVYGHAPDPAFFSTSVFRGADENLTKTWAAHLAKEGILVNQVNIGVIVTPQWENIRNMRAPELSMDDFFAKTVSEDIPVGRVGQPEELADVVTFLASARSSYVTGSSIDVAGGMGLRF